MTKSNPCPLICTGLCVAWRSCVLTTEDRECAGLWVWVCVRVRVCVCVWMFSRSSICSLACCSLWLSWVSAVVGLALWFGRAGINNVESLMINPMHSSLRLQNDEILLVFRSYVRL